MPNAGTPAAVTTPTTGTPPGGHQPAEDARPGAFTQFLHDGTQRAKKQRKQRKKSRKHDGGRPQDWADPDPGAAMALPERRHPVHRMVARSQQRYRRGIAMALRVVLELLLGVPTGSLPLSAAFDHPWHLMTVDDAAELRRRIYRTYPRQTTRNDKVSLVRRVVSQCHSAGLISPLRRDRLLEELYTIAPGPTGAGRALTDQEIADLMGACSSIGSRRARARNTAIVAVLRSTGARISEVLKLELADWDRQQGTLLLRKTKNGRDHLVYLHPVATGYLAAWARVRGERPGPLFSNLNEPSATAPLHPVSIRYMLRTRAAAAGVAPFGTHDFRRTFASDMLMRYDAALVSKLLNHTKLDSTLVYDRRGDDVQRAAVGSVRLPGRAGGAAA
ncbi:tyrosine-type recombinase/integrase [Cellulomonas alba]|uniref:Site-specific integrase n=1 Tax=Cellulomonas alba TaxID=3053467 RepID=A0ABT7SBU3_9CELL|nr:site-specific integrase [Cellulomonas alba]MDM7853657.1 site-specific integrase [Cellulomonas alba]